MPLIRALNTTDAIFPLTKAPLILFMQLTVIRLTGLSLTLLLANPIAYASEPVTNKPIPAAYEESDSSESCLPNWSSRSSIAEYNQNNARGLKLVRHGAAYDLIDAKGSVLYTKLYEIQPYDDDRLVAKRQGKKGVIGGDGQLILDFSYHDILLSPDTSVYSVEILDTNDTGYALIDASGNWIYPHASKNQSALAAAKDIEVIYPMHTNDHTATSYFKVTVRSHEQYTDTIANTGVIDHRGRIVVPIAYYRIDGEVNCNTSRMSFRGMKGGYAQIINDTGKIIAAGNDNQSIRDFNRYDGLYILSHYTPESLRANNGLDHNGLINDKIIDEQGRVILESDTSIKLLDGDSHIYRFSVNHKFGLVDGKGNIIVAPIFDNITEVSSFTSVLKVERSGKQALLIYDEATDTLTPSDYYDNVSRVYYHLPHSLQQLLARSESVDLSDDKLPVVAPKDNNSPSLNPKLEPNYITNKYGYEYDANELFIFTKEGKQGLMTTHSQVLVPNNYDSIDDYENLLRVRQGDKYGLLSTYNETVLPIAYDEITEDDRINSDDNLFMVKKDGYQGVLDRFGQVVIPLSDMRIPSIANSSLEDILIIEKDGLYGLIEMATAQPLLPAAFEQIDINYYSDYILAQKDGRYELYDRAGNIIYRASDDIVKIDTVNTTINLYDLTGFEPSLSVETKDNYILIENQDGLYGLVDEASGQLILPGTYDNIKYAPTADSLENLRNGIMTPLFIGTKEGQSLLLNKAGEVLMAEQKDIFTIPYLPYIITMTEAVGSNSASNSEPNKLVMEWSQAGSSLSASGYKMGLVGIDGKTLLAEEYSMLMPYFDGDAVYIYAIKDNTAYRYDEYLQLVDTKTVAELEQVLTPAWRDK